MNLPGFAPKGPSLPPPPPAPPARDDPAIVEAKKKLRLAELQRKGRAATILAPEEAKLGNPPVERPEARGGAALLGS